MKKNIEYQTWVKFRCKSKQVISNGFLHLVKTNFAFGKKTAVHSRFYVQFYNFAHRIQQ